MNIEKLEQAILHNKTLYYYGKAEISDEAYDGLEQQLRRVKPDSPVLSYVGHKLTGEKIQHSSPMLSLEKLKDVEDLKKWSNGQILLASDKVDGSAGSLIYENALLVSAKTRGDGIFGEDITGSVAYMNIPKILGYSNLDSTSRLQISEIRGEICITKENFAKLQREMVKRGLPQPESIRNCVAGLLHRKEHADLCQYLSFLAYDLKGIEYSSEGLMFFILVGLGFEQPNLVEVKSSMDIEDLINLGPQDRPYLTDGLVFSIDDTKKQLERGFTAHHPRGKVAFKFQSESAITIIRNIITDVGRTGKISFVAEVDPVFLSGATINKVTLHNWKYIQTHNLSVGAEIEITRSNEVIPKHVKTLKSDGPMQILSGCPLCGSPLELSDTQVDLSCTSIVCPAKAYGLLEHWVKIVEIDNMGDETLKDLFSSEKVKTVDDFYKLTVSDLEELPRSGKKSAKKLFDNIQKTKNVPLDKFLAALGIKGFGRSVSKTVGEKFLSLDKVFSVVSSPVAVRTLGNIDGIGDILASNIVKGLKDYGFTTVQLLRQAGVTITDLQDPADCVLSGQVFVITGSLVKPRKMIEDMIKQKGGKVASSVSAKTNYLVCNELSGSSKSRKAQELNIPIISEEKLIKLIS